MQKLIAKEKKKDKCSFKSMVIDLKNAKLVYT